MSTNLVRGLRYERRALALAAALSGAFVAGCATEPITGRSQLALLSEEQANAMGVQAFAETLKGAKLSSNPDQVRLVEKVGRRIARVTDVRMAAEGRRPYEWEFKVIDAPDVVNAFALPGGKVAVYTGILPVAVTEAGLAVVLGHEIAHAYAQHGRKRVSENVIAQFGLSAVEAFLGGDSASENSKLALAALGIGYKVGVELPFSRADESAADEIGLMLMAEAGYDPREAVPFWERMAKAGGGGGIEFLSTHPEPGNRAARIRELLPKALEAYEKAK
ncbi:MAG: M48 family metallopeptidase [Planctomycetota bacterium]